MGNKDKPLSKTDKLTTSNKIILVCLQILLYFPGLSLCQSISVPTINEHETKYLLINFNFHDSIIPYTLFVEPDRSFYFKKDFRNPSKNVDEHFFRIENKREITRYKNVYKLKSDSILTIQSYFPLLMTRDSAYSVNLKSIYTPYSLFWHLDENFNPIPLIYELEYSFILTNLAEPRLFNSNKYRSLRFVSPEEDRKSKGAYSSIRIDFLDSIAVLNYSVSDFDSMGNASLKQHYKCSISGKKLKRLETAIAEINFDKEHVFTTADHSEKYLIEYKNGSNYYVLNKPYHFNSNRDAFFKLYRMVYSMSLDCNEKL